MDKILEQLEAEFFYLKQLWEEYKKLLSKKESIEEINKYCGQCFQVIQLAMNNEIIITINRLLDKEKTGKNENLVLESLKKYFNDENQIVLKAKIDCIREIREICKLKELRDKRLAHRDIKQESSFLLINYDCIEKIIKMIGEVFKFYRKKKQLKYMEYNELITPPGCEILIEAVKFFNKNYFKEKLKS